MAHQNPAPDEKGLDLPDCGGLMKNGKCRWLKITNCTGADCSFYQTAESLANARERLQLLDEPEQEHISRKYYGGARPWADPGKKSRRK